MEIGVYQRHPIPWNQRGPDGLWCFHFELLYLKKGIAPAVVCDWPPFLVGLGH